MGWWNDFRANPEYRNWYRYRSITLLLIPLMILAIVVPLSGLSGPVGAESAGRMGVEGDGEHYLGRRPIPPEMVPELRSMVPKAPSSRLQGRALPSSVNLSSELPPVGDQGSQGSCVAWATGYYQKTHSEKKFEHTTWDLANPWYQFSPSFVYNQINGGGDYGSWPWDAYELMETKGCVDIAEMPYSDGDCTTQPTAQQLDAAKPYKIQNNWAALWNNFGDSPPYSSPNPIDVAKQWLADGYVLSAGITMTTDLYNPSIVYYDPPLNPLDPANHQVAFCGYDDNINPGGSDPDHQGGFLMVNSWGSDWNGDMHGYIWLSYNYVKYCIEDTWVIHNMSPDDPVITGVDPLNGDVGDSVTITGNNLGTNRRNSEVTFNGVQAFVLGWTNESMTVQVPPTTSGPVIVYDWEGTPSNEVNFAVETTPEYPTPTVTSITPSSGTNDDVVNITNLKGSNFRNGATVKLIGPSGSGETGAGTINATNVNVVSSTKITCKFDLTGAAAGSYKVTVTNDDGKSGSKAGIFTVDESEVTTPTWFLAEGSTDWGYDCYISIENPNDSAVSATVTYMTDAGAVPGGDIDLPANSQATIDVSAVLGDKDFSTKVECKEGKTIAVDRTMTWTGEGAPSPDGHCSIGVTSPATTWYLAEGSSAWGFECWLLIQNPNAAEATAQVTYMIEGADPVTVEKKVPAQSRKTYSMANDIGAEDASIKVTADIPVIPERAMYRNNRRSGHDSIGTTAAAPSYYLAEGTTDWGFTTYVLVQNPNDTATDVTVTYMTSSGAVPQGSFNMPGNSRKTIRVNDVLPASDFSTQVSGSQPIIAERAMYWGDTEGGEASHDSIGLAAPHTTFYLPDGQTSEGRETYTLVQNPNDTDVTVEVTYLTPDGAGNVTFEETVTTNSRMTYSMADKGINGRAAIMVTCKTAGKKIMVERAMYWNNRGAGTDTIGGYSD